MTCGSMEIAFTHFSAHVIICRYLEKLLKNLNYRAAIYNNSYL